MQKRRNAHTHTHTLFILYTLTSTHPPKHSLTHTHSCKYAHTSLPCVLTSKCTCSQKPKLIKIECDYQMGMGDPNALSFGPALTRVKFCADSTKVQWMRLKITYTHSRSCSLCQFDGFIIYILDYIEYKHKQIMVLLFQNPQLDLFYFLEYGNAVWALC